MNAKRIEEMMLNHWPALTTMVHEGWLLPVLVSGGELITGNRVKLGSTIE